MRARLWPNAIHHYNHVCFECHTSLRSTAKYELRKCPSCGKRMFYLHDRLKVPAKNKIKEWAVLKEQAFNLGRGLIHVNRTYGYGK